MLLSNKKLFNLKSSECLRNPPNWQLLTANSDEFINSLLRLGNKASKKLKWLWIKMLILESIYSKIGNKNIWCGVYPPSFSEQLTQQPNIRAENTSQILFLILLWIDSRINIFIDNHLNFFDVLFPNLNDEFMNSSKLAVNSCQLGRFRSHSEIAQVEQFLKLAFDIIPRHR